jgi:hypothetical protein
MTVPIYSAVAVWARVPGVAIEKLDVAIKQLVSEGIHAPVTFCNKYLRWRELTFDNTIPWRCRRSGLAPPLSAHCVVVLFQQDGHRRLKGLPHPQENQRCPSGSSCGGLALHLNYITCVGLSWLDYQLTASGDFKDYHKSLQNMDALKPENTGITCPKDNCETALI